MNSYGYNSQITELPYVGEQFNQIKDDVVQSGAVFIPAIMPTGVKFSEITPTVAQQIADVLEQFTSQGVEVWLRFAHEMNWYAGKGQVYPGGSMYRRSPIFDVLLTERIFIAPDEFITAWQNVHAAVANNSKILMFWCPNIDPNENIQPWWPGADYVDIVGVDNYPPAGTSFSSAYGEFYNGFAARYNKNFCIGETGSLNGGTVESKEAWVSELANVDLSEFPCYKSATWFEYVNPVDAHGSKYDYRIIEEQSPATVKRILSYFK